MVPSAHSFLCVKFAYEMILFLHYPDAYDIHHLQIEWIENEPITKNMNITASLMNNSLEWIPDERHGHRQADSRQL